MPLCEPCMTSIWCCWPAGGGAGGARAAGWAGRARHGGESLRAEGTAPLLSVCRLHSLRQCLTVRCLSGGRRPKAWEGRDLASQVRAARLSAICARVSLRSCFRLQSTLRCRKNSGLRSLTEPRCDRRQRVAERRLARDAPAPSGGGGGGSGQVHTMHRGPILRWPFTRPIRSVPLHSSRPLSFCASGRARLHLPASS